MAVNEVIVFPDAAAITITWVKAQLTARGQPSVKVGSRFPKDDKIGSIVRIHRTGGPSSLFVIDDAQLTVECEADKDEDAHDLAQLVRGLIMAMRATVQSGVTIYGIREFSGPQESPDPVTGRPRYVQNIQVSTRGTAA